MIPFVQDCIPVEDCQQVNNPLVISGFYDSRRVTVTLTSRRTDLSQRSEPLLEQHGHCFPFVNSICFRVKEAGALQFMQRLNVVAFAQSPNTYS